MSEFKGYARKGEIKLRPVTQEEIELGSDNLIEKVGVSISPEDIAAGSPKEGDMIAVNPENNLDLWLVNKEYFEKNQVIAEAYKFISGVIQYIKKQNNNPKHKRYLKI